MHVQQTDNFDLTPLNICPIPVEKSRTMRAIEVAVKNKETDMAKKQAVNNPRMPNFGSVFSWGFKLSDFDEVFFVTGHGDCNADFITQYPGDPVAQTKQILENMKQLIEEAGFSIHDIVRTDWTFVKEVTHEDFDGIAKAWEAFLEPLEHKPATGTLRYVDRLGAPDMLVEYEMILAR